MVRRIDYCSDNEKKATYTVICVFIILVIDSLYLYFSGNSIGSIGVSTIAAIILTSWWVYLSRVLPERINDASKQEGVTK